MSPLQPANCCPEGGGLAVTVTVVPTSCCPLPLPPLTVKVGAVAAVAVAAVASMLSFSSSSCPPCRAASAALCQSCLGRQRTPAIGR